MKYILYYSPGAASFAVHWMLVHINESIDAVRVDLDSGAQHRGEYRHLNPMGRVPTLIIDGAPRGESTALLMLLAERHPEADLAPSPGSADRAQWMELMIYLANTLLPAMRDWFYADVDGAGIDADHVRSLARKRIEEVWVRLDNNLANANGYLVGEKLSTVDFLAIMLMRWSRDMPRPATDWPHVLAYVTKLRALSSFIEVNEKEGLRGWNNSVGVAIDC